MDSTNNFFKPRPVEPYLLHENGGQNKIYQCSCCSQEEYEDFLISEYGAENVLRVKRENEERERKIQEAIDRMCAAIPLETDPDKKKELLGLIFILAMRPGRFDYLEEMQKNGCS